MARVPRRPEALSLLDLRQSSKLVQVGDDQEIEVFGLTAESVGDLMGRFPTLQRFLMSVGLTREDILKEVPGAIAAIIAAGCGHGNSEEHEKAASEIELEGQAAMIEAILQCTFTRGFGPFASRLQAMGLQATTAPVGRDLGSRSPPRSPTTSATTEETAGASPPDSSSPTATSASEDASLTPEPSSS